MLFRSLDPSTQVLASPIWNDQGEVSASMVIQAPGGRTSPEWADLLRGAAQRVSASLGASIG